jgi:hypothetical protein
LSIVNTSAIVFRYTGSAHSPLRATRWPMGDDFGGAGVGVTDSLRFCDARAKASPALA